MAYNVKADVDQALVQAADQYVEARDRVARLVHEQVIRPFCQKNDLRFVSRGATQGYSDTYFFLSLRDGMCVDESFPNHTDLLWNDDDEDQMGPIWMQDLETVLEVLQVKTADGTELGTHVPDYDPRDWVPEIPSY